MKGIFCCLSKNIFLPILLATCFWGSSAEAKTYLYPEPQGLIQFDIPAEWEASPDSDETTLSSKDDHLIIMVWQLEGTNKAEILTSLKERLLFYLADLKQTPGTQPKTTQLGDLSLLLDEGTGLLDEELPVDWRLAVVMGKKPVAILSMVESGYLKDYLKPIEAMIKSIRPASQVP